MIKTAIIGGTGFYTPEVLESAKNHIQDTPFGQVSVITGIYKENEIAFIPRHGARHGTPPHLINYRANILALKKMGVENILATAAVGSLYFEFKPGQMVLADQFLDFTKSRPNTFYEGGERGVIHCDMTAPYCPFLRHTIVEVGKTMGVGVHNGGVYVCTEGPRFETAAEIEMFKMLGGHLIGMTSVPEATLARELGICYANICIVTNFAAGIAPGILTHSEVVDMMNSVMGTVRPLLLESALLISKPKNCTCANILSEAGIMK
ncbi:MAG: S-methyl-5'-thioadenosine phosphorylase [Syntrophomonadaceae bacterium]|jgi:5'-methylthioadenosine phosphorylase|nr:S-methyl-5'-thioadenosine phosphorylase [Syntrophomonadaceae bacterium]